MTIEEFITDDTIGKFMNDNTITDKNKIKSILCMPKNIPDSFIPESLSPIGASNTDDDTLAGSCL